MPFSPPQLASVIGRSAARSTFLGPSPQHAGPRDGTNPPLQFFFLFLATVIPDSSPSATFVYMPPKFFVKAIIGYPAQVLGCGSLETSDIIIKKNIFVCFLSLKGKFALT